MVFPKGLVVYKAMYAETATKGLCLVLDHADVDIKGIKERNKAWKWQSGKGVLSKPQKYRKKFIGNVKMLATKTPEQLEQLP